MFQKYRLPCVLLICLALKISTASAGFLGGLQSISVEDSSVKSAAQTVMEKINRHNERERGLILVEIEEAKYQVVSGIKYVLHLKIGETNCPKGQVVKKCKLDESRPLLACGAEILDQPWLHSTKINHHCEEYYI
ncbi:GSCOCT00006959001.2-RA-CDS [Cotesia congregata]|uniref:Cystatin_Cell n=1 Tax=Cotesia congregata TaxID=51543 RepID=A0A8J2HCW2_COTCN|nr:GSCOCT00006959001.2-RA-CDS [Cotesia congregata]CAG5092650.1 cystatin_Cell [Cotesia congregata]